MIFVRFDEMAIPQELRDEAQRLTRDLIAKDSEEERKKFIEKRHKFWRRLVPYLSSMSNGKCWYSEAKELVSYMHVDHFRPKDGYWWLAFKLSNYRFAGAVMNVKKSNIFGLGENSFKALCPTDDETLENCLLLDPCSDFDYCLLTFDEFGKAVPACPESTFDNQRARESIKVYQLNHEPLAEARREVWMHCEEQVMQAARIMLHQGQARAVTNERLKEIILGLKTMLTPDAELSSVAKACLLKSPHRWANNLAAGR